MPVKRNSNYYSQIKWREGTLVPATDTDVETADSILTHLTLTNITAGAITVTVADKQATARELLKTKSIAANDSLTLMFPGGKLMKGGFSWSASAANSIVGSYSARQQ